VVKEVQAGWAKVTAGAAGRLLSRTGTADGWAAPASTQSPLLPPLWLDLRQRGCAHFMLVVLRDGPDQRQGLPVRQRVAQGHDVTELFAHDGRAADRASQRRLVEVVRTTGESKWSRMRTRSRRVTSGLSRSAALLAG
jgi:hypothetical protein